VPLQVGVGEHEQLPHPGVASDDGDRNLAAAQLRDLRVELGVLVLRRQLVEPLHRLARWPDVGGIVSHQTLTQLLDTDESTTW